MDGVDVILIAIVLLSVIFGAVRGFVREVAGLASWLVAIWVAWRFSGFLQPHLNGALETPVQKAWAARVIVLLVMLFVGHVIGEVLSWAMHTAAGLSGLDRFLGTLFGFLRGVVIVGFLVMVGHGLSFEQEGWWQGAKLAPYADYVGEWLESFSGHTHTHHHHAESAPAPAT
jgi:membrane protein required for colicin V production